MRGRPSVLAGVLAGLVLLGGAWWLMESPALVAWTPGRTAALVVAAIVGELLPLPRPVGRAVPLSVAVLCLAALLGAPPPLAAAVGLLAWVADAVVSAFRGQRVRWFAALPRALGGWAMTGAVGIGAHALPQPAIAPSSMAGTGGIPWASVLLVAVVVMAGLPALDAAEADQRSRVGFADRLRELASTGWMGGAALAAGGAVGAITYLAVGWPALLLTLLPLLAARAGLGRYVSVRRTYDETVRAMSRLPEHVGALPPEHGLRVAALVHATGGRLDLDRRTLAQLDRAAHLHELGRIQLDPGESAPGGELARASGAIVREAGSLDDVATIIEQHRFASADASPRQALAADILRLACDLDSGVVGPGDGLRETISVLARQVPHNPAVATAMAEVLHRGEGQVTAPPARGAAAIRP